MARPAYVPFTRPRAGKPVAIQHKPELEVLEDRLVLNAKYNFDFGTVRSPIAPEFIRVASTTPQVSHIAGAHGWSASNSLRAIDRGITSAPLTSDFHQGRAGSFFVNVPNGVYEVAITLGDRSAAHTSMYASLESRTVFSGLSTAKGEYVRRVFTTNVTDGKLSLQIGSAGGKSPTFALNSLEVTFKGGLPGTLPPPPPPPPLPGPTNSPPTNLSLSSAAVNENAVAGTLIGTLASTDPNVGNTFTYTLVSGAGSTDNVHFRIVGNQLQTNVPLDHEAQSSRTVRVRTTDNGGLWFEKAFTISVQNRNETPTNVALSNSTVNTGQPVGTLVGLLVPSDADAGDTFTYTLVAGTGSTHNSSFRIVGNQLQTNAVLSGSQARSVRIRITDAGGLSLEKTFSITINGVNNAPTDLALGGTAVGENLPVGTPIGNLATTDPNAGDTFTYTLVGGAGSTDNAFFRIVGNQLQTNASFDHEVQSNRSVRVRTTDAGGLWYEEAFTVTIQNANEAPITLAVSNNTLGENMPAGTLVGLLSTTDPDAGDTFNYTLVAGSGSADNGRFVIQGNQLRTAAVLNNQAGGYNLRVRSTDAGGLTAEQTFNIRVNTINQPLMQRSDMEYLGAFRLPIHSNAGDEFSFATGTLGFNPVNNSLFITGHYGGVAEVSIPQSIVNSTNINNLAMANVLQPLTPILNRLPTQLLDASDGVRIGGLTVHNGRLVGSVYAWYTGALTQTRSHFYLDSLNLATSNAYGLYQLTGGAPRAMAGYMAQIPAEWQGALGAPYLTGLGGVNIVSTSSSGPAAYGFDPANLGATATPALEYLRYPVEQPLGAYTGPANPLYNGNSAIRGAVFVPGTNSVLFIGRTGANYNGYADPWDLGDPWGGGRGPHSLNGEYAYQVWAYNANDFLAVRQGAMQPWQLRPYSVWNFNFPISYGSKDVGGVAFDQSTGRLYMSILEADWQPNGILVYQPLIQVFQLTAPEEGATAPTTPEMGTLSATPSDNRPGAFPVGMSVLLTAGNIYATSANTTITQVTFYYDSNQNGVLDLGVDQQLGTGSGLPASDGNHSRYTMATTNLTSGIHRVFARALDSNGLTSSTLTTTFTLL
jgi:hypothetical protein